MSLLLILFSLMMIGTASSAQADGEILAFAVVSEVPKDKARIRVQLSAAHTKEHLDKAISSFTEVGKMLQVI